MIALIAIAAMLLLSGCIMLEGVGSPGYAPALPESGMRPVAPLPLDAVSSGKQVIKTGDIQIEVPEGTLEQNYQRLLGILASNDAEVSSVSFNEYSNERVYYVTAKVKPASFEKLIGDLKPLGRLLQVSTNVEDVTQQYHDLEMRIKSKEVQLARLYEFYNKSNTVEELIKVEEQVSRIEYELESLKQQKEYYDKQIARSTVTIRLSERKSPIQSALFDPLSQLLGIFLTAVAVGTTLLVGLIGLLLPAAVLAAIAKIAWDFLKRPQKKRKLTEI